MRYPLMVRRSRPIGRHYWPVFKGRRLPRAYAVGAPQRRYSPIQPGCPCIRYRARTSWRNRRGGFALDTYTATGAARENALGVKGDFRAVDSIRAACGYRALAGCERFVFLNFASDL